MQKNMSVKVNRFSLTFVQSLHMICRILIQHRFTEVQFLLDAAFIVGIVLKHGLLLTQLAICGKNGLLLTSIYLFVFSIEKKETALPFLCKFSYFKRVCSVCLLIRIYKSEACFCKELGVEFCSQVWLSFKNMFSLLELSNLKDV